MPLIKGMREEREAEGQGDARTQLRDKPKTLQSAKLKSGQGWDKIQLFSLTKSASQLGTHVGYTCWYLQAKGKSLKEKS